MARSLVGFTFDLCNSVRILAVEAVRSFGHFVDDALDAWGDET